MEKISFQTESLLMTQRTLYGDIEKKLLSDEPFHYNFHEKMNYEFSLSLLPYKTEATLHEKLIW